MSAPRAPFLGVLREAADAAAAAETAFRREAAERIKALEQERTFAFRRLNVMRSVVDAMRGNESEEVAVSAALAALRVKLTWSGDSESRSLVLSRFELVAQALHASLLDGPDKSADDVRRTLGAFEDWYQATYATPFWSLFEHYMAETPVVDF